MVRGLARHRCTDASLPLLIGRMTFSMSPSSKKCSSWLRVRTTQLLPSRSTVVDTRWYRVRWERCSDRRVSYAEVPEGRGMVREVEDRDRSHGSSLLPVEEPTPSTSRRACSARIAALGRRSECIGSMSVTVIGSDAWRRRARSWRAASVRQQVSQWVGRCPGCGAWGTIDADRRRHGRAASGRRGRPRCRSMPSPAEAGRVDTGIAGLDRVLGGGLVPGSVVLLSGEPGIGKSTLLLQLVASLGADGPVVPVGLGRGIARADRRAGPSARHRGRHGVVRSRARARGRAARSPPPSGRSCWRSTRSRRSATPSGTQMPGGVSQVRTCTDALVGMAKSQGVAVIMTGHVTKDGDLAGPRALEHAVDVVLGVRRRRPVRVAGPGRRQESLRARRRERLVRDGRQPDSPRSIPHRSWSRASACRAPRRPSLARAGEHSRSRSRRWSGRPMALPAARPPASTAAASSWWQRCSIVRPGSPLGRSELFGASSGGVRIDDPACDLGDRGSAGIGRHRRALPPAGAAFVGEVSLTGLVRSAPGHGPAPRRRQGCGLLQRVSQPAGERVPIPRAAGGARCAPRSRSGRVGSDESNDRLNSRR